MDYNLQIDEGVLLQSIKVKRMGGSDSLDELILTNLNIIYIDRGRYTKNVKKVLYFPVEDIKRIDGKAQVALGQNGRNSSLQLQIYFNNGVESFEFSKKAKKEIKKWIKTINSIIDNMEIEEESKAIPGVKVVTETIRDTFGVIANTLTKNKKLLTSKCTGCNAILTGYKKEVVRCKYCDTKNIIK
ncbi:hypothetical protein KHQ88_01170 [Mycoplasmatota bacterium]|nr:hypothetical protein KHQ88_01170 [Mycoplasmatota bacterium]